MMQRHSWVLAIGGLVVSVALIAPAVSCAQEKRTPDATIVVSTSPASSVLGLTLVEGTLRLRGKVYLLTLRGVQSSKGATGKVYNLGQPRDIEGPYTSTADGLRNERGVTIAFDPPLDLQGGQLRIDLSSRVYPKASTGQRGTVD